MATVRQNPVLYYALGFLFILAISVRALGFYFIEQHELRWVAVAILVAFTLLYWTERGVSQRFGAYLHLCLALQTALALSLLLLPPYHFFAAGLGIVLSAQAVMLLPRRQAYGWIGAITGALIFGLVRGHGLLDGLSLGLLYVVAFLFTGAYAAAVAAATASQERTAALLSDLQKAHDQLRAFANQAEQLAVVEERQRLARDLHDSVIQGLYGLILSAEGASRKLAEGQVGLVTERLHDIRQTAQSALDEMRSLIFELRPPDLQKEGLVAALRARLETVEARAGLQTELDVEGEGRLSHRLEAGLYWVVQEALNNALRHSAADKVVVSLRLRPKAVELEVIDNGVGFDPSARGGLGLRGMYERAEQLGGKLDFYCEPGQGTRVRLEVPQSQTESGS